MIDFNFVLNLATRSTDINEYLCSLYNMIVQSNSKTVIELGAGYSTFALLAGVNDTGGHLYTIDMNESAQTRAHPDALRMLADEPNYTFIGRQSMDVAKDWTDKADFIFHDTSHVYDQTKEELMFWPAMVNPRGFYVMHDTAHLTGNGVGCRKALDEWYAENSKDWVIAHLLDTKHLGMSILIKIGGQ